jgi:hypothetical protein
MILFLPIDIDLSNFDFNQFDNSRKLKAFNPYWDSSVITADTIFKNNFSGILQQLPFVKVTTLTHKIQKAAVGEHVDVYPEMKLSVEELDHIRQNEPSGYRIVLKGNTDRLQIFNGSEWVTAYTPTAPCCYLLNATAGVHRVLEDIDREIIYIRGFLDIDKHRELIKKSFEKYEQYAIQSLL